MPTEPRQPTRVMQVIRPAAGGMKAHVLQLATGLRSRGFECEIACPGDSELVHDALEAGIIIHPVPIVGPLRPFRDLMAVVSLAEVLRERRPALVHAHGSKAGLIARLAVRIGGGAPTIVTVHNQVLYGGVSPFMRRIYIWMERALSRRTARTITVSDALRAELVDVIGIDASKVVTVHNGLPLGPLLAGGNRDAARRRYGIPDGALAFGLAARFAPQKALDVLVAAALPVLERYPDAWLVLAGSGPLLESIKTQARASSLRDRILFPGYETDVRGLLAALDIYASSAIAEGLGLATIEAMAAGLPVVSTTAGGTPEVVEDGVTGLLVAPGKVAPFTEALLRLAKDPVLRRRMGEAGRARARAEFDEDRMLDRIAGIYREVLA
ncbi:MAG TPA: glycosyltransferase family 4 protein [Coriobacteriia bacterium]